MVTEARFWVRGARPILQNNPACMVPEAIEGVKVGAVKSGPEEQAKIRTYENKDGTLYVPSDWARMSLLYAARGMKIGKRSAPAIISCAVFNVTDKFNLVHPETKNPIRDWETYARSVVIKGRGRIMRGRPMIREWACEVILSIDEEFIKVEQVLELFKRAGKVSGWGDFRPEHKGDWGMFTVELLPAKEVKEVKKAG